MNIHAFAEKVIELSPLIARGFLQDARHFLAKCEITLPQFLVLDFLSRNEKSTMNTLAKHLRITPPATTGLIDRLINQELVTRNNDIKDRRIIWIELTQKGQAMVSAIKKQKIQGIVNMFSHISTEDRSRYLNVLEQLVQASAAPAVPKKKPVKNALMNKVAAIVIVLLLLPVTFLCAQEQKKEEAPLALMECYRLALKQSELVAIDAQRIKQAEARFLQAFGTLLPQVSFGRSDNWQRSSLLPSYDHGFDSKFTFKQNLFSGFKEYAAVKASKLEKKQYQSQKWRTEQLLFVDVSDAFYLLLETREDLVVLQRIKRALLDRIKDLRDRERIGKSRLSEIVSTQTQLYGLDSEIESVKQSESIARQLLEFLIGRSVGAIIDPQVDFNLKTESQYLALAAFRPDVEAAHFAWQSDQKKIAIARSGLLPQVSLESDYYTHRTSIPQDSEWSTNLTLDVPIFEGTTTYGQIREAASQAKVSELLFQRQGRQAVQEIHDAYINLNAGFAKKRKLARALTSAQHNYFLQRRDYKSNIVNNLDVLAAIQNLGNTKRSHVHASYELKRFYWQLLVAAGEIKPEK
jgi:outer membrane protein